MQNHRLWYAIGIIIAYPGGIIKWIYGNLRESLSAPAYKSVFRHQEIKRGYSYKTYHEHVHEFFRNTGITPDNVILAKSYSVQAHIESNFEKLKVDNFELDEQWLCKEPTIIQGLLTEGHL